MGKEEEILEFLEKGLKPTEIIKKGYAKSTVYKTYSIFRGIRQKKGMLKIKYIISKLEDKATHIIMTLIEYREIPKEEIERARIEAELERPVDIVGEGEQLQKVELAPKPETFEEKIIVAMKKQAPEVFETLKTPVPSHIKPPTIILQSKAFKPTEINLYLTREQYAQLGSPPLLSLINMTLRMAS